MTDEDRDRLIATIQRADQRGDTLERENAELRIELERLRGDRGREQLHKAIQLARTAGYLMMLVVLFGATMVVTRACSSEPAPAPCAERSVQP